ncbi:MAG TPA: zinc ribbon domain-containing protein, partial [Acetobacteraceae bacterium]|nr:zinc ribbon domain-containing protein [Acetobacteraceae bacterium]
AGGSKAEHPSLLAGLAYDGDSQTRLTPAHANKDGKRYRYYVSQTLITGARSASPRGRRIPANDLEQVVVGRVRRFLTDEAALFAALGPIVEGVAERRRLLDRASRLAGDWPKLAAAEARRLLRSLLMRVVLHAGRIELHLLPGRLPQLLSDGSRHVSLNTIPGEAAGSPLILSMPASLQRAGKEMAMVLGPEPATAPTADPAMLRLILRARALWDKVQRGEVAGLGELAIQAGVSSSYATRLVRLAFLAPDVLSAIIEGRQPEGLTAARLLQECRRGLPLDWQQQRATLDFI